jgi:hypothetical protein
MRKYYDKSSRMVLNYKVGDLVILDSKNFQIHYFTKKFDHKILEPF